MAIKKANKMQHFFRLITKIPAKCRFKANIMHIAHVCIFFALSLKYSSFRLFLLTASVPNNFFRFAFYIFVSLQVKQNSTRHPVLLVEFIHQLEDSCRVANPNQSKSIFSRTKQILYKVVASWCRHSMPIFKNMFQISREV